jgi:hypothetical protein
LAMILYFFVRVNKSTSMSSRESTKFAKLQMQFLQKEYLK